jgi:hypothetical protein
MNLVFVLVQVDVKSVVTVEIKVVVKTSVPVVTTVVIVVGSITVIVVNIVSVVKPVDVVVSGMVTLMLTMLIDTLPEITVVVVVVETVLVRDPTVLVVVVVVVVVVVEERAAAAWHRTLPDNVLHPNNPPKISTIPPTDTKEQSPAPTANPLNELIWAFTDKHKVRSPVIVSKSLVLILASCNPRFAQACAAKLAGTASVIRVNPPA